MTLTLRVADLGTMDAAVAGDESLSGALGGVAIAEGWAVFDEAVRALRDQLADDPDSTRWGTRLFLLDDPPTLVGWGGFKGPPADGVVEVGYSIAPAFRGRGLATDATCALLAEAFDDREVAAVIAHTLPEHNASTRVLEKTGFTLDGDALEGEQPVWRWITHR
jgi:RimJ/RimL family protein N-acetyltransferase